MDMEGTKLWMFGSRGGGRNEISKILDSSSNPVATIKSLLLQMFWNVEGEGSLEESGKMKDWMLEFISKKSPESIQLGMIMEKVKKKMAMMEGSGIEESVPRGVENFMNLEGNPAGFFSRDLEDFQTKTGERTRGGLCRQCGSKEAKPVSLVSHSCSVDALIGIFSVKLPNLKLMKVLDIGCGLGSILWAAYHSSDADSIVGIELNRESCEIVEQTIEKYGMGNRIRIIQGDIRDHKNELGEADLILFNNAFEYFVPREEQIVLWQFIKDSVKGGALLVTNPSMEDLLNPLQPQLGFTSDQWTEPYVFHPPEENLVRQMTISLMEKTDEDFRVYKVLSQ